jgi:hypothetical protein
MAIQKKTPMIPNFPKNPNKNYVPFDNPQVKCSVYLCPNFCTPICGLCELHCRKIHKGVHSKETKKELDELIDKYLKLRDK